MGVKRDCVGAERLARRTRRVKGPHLATHDQLGFSNLATEVSDKHAELSLPSRLQTGQAGAPVELEGPSRARHQRRRRGVEPGEDLGGVSSGGEGEEAVAGRRTAKGRERVNRATRGAGRSTNAPGASDHLDVGNSLPTHPGAALANVTLVHPDVEVTEMQTGARARLSRGAGLMLLLLLRRVDGRLNLSLLRRRRGRRGDDRVGVVEEGGDGGSRRGGNGWGKG